MASTDTRTNRGAWIKWLENYGIGKFYDAFVAYAQGARSTCQNCGELIYLDIVEGGGIPDWGTAMTGCKGLDYGCPDSPDTTDEGTGGHVPIKLWN